MFSLNANNSHHEDPRVKALLGQLTQRFNRISARDQGIDQDIDQGAGFQALEIAAYHFPRGYDPLQDSVEGYLEVLNGLYADLESLDKADEAIKA